MDDTDDSLHLCAFCRSIDWAELTTGLFNAHKLPLKNGTFKRGEHNLRLIRSSPSCELCSLIATASQTLKPWWPIAELLDQPEGITCAFWCGRNKLGDSLQSQFLANTGLALDTMYQSLKPGYKTNGLVLQGLLDELAAKGIRVGRDKDAEGSGRGRGRNVSLNRLLVQAGISPVEWTAQTFVQLHPCLHPVPSVDKYATDEEPFAVFPSGRVVGEEVSVGLLRRWYRTCHEKHTEKCSRPTWLAADTSWPERLRLIDVRTLCIVEAPDECPYFALSYVWGDEKDPFQALLGQLEVMKVPGYLEEQTLPRTIVDAMVLTKEMGVDYLWVDRLCVIQDSDADKAVQIPQMDLVYSRAALTIVAAGGTALDGLAGINGTSRSINQKIARVAQDLSLMDVLHLDQGYGNSRWTTRGWTFQEGLCSPRILIITTDQVFWSCETSKCCETIAFEAFPTPVAPDDIIFNVLSGHRVFGEVGGGQNFAFGELDSMIRSYCTRKLTVQADVLDAFTGVLRRVAVNTGHEFYWGHSVSTRFDESLAWMNIVWYRDHEWQKQDLPERRCEMHRVRAGDGTVHRVRFPSWSWLGWKNVLGVTRAAPKQVLVEPELEIMKLGLDGKAAQLRSAKEQELKSVLKLDMCGIDRTTSAGWKGDTSIDPSLLHTDEDGEFRDSGRLLFWTSHAVLDLEDGKMYNDAREEVGELKPFWPSQMQKPSGKQSFIVVSRKHNDDNLKVLKAERRLNVLLVEWEDPVKHVASRICSAEVDEAAWVGLGERREWILVTLT
ncbi:HET-domain-containing protein [Annulohypoxylon truncatum]|uniref:HET-domain-containing protein n=1 Tax=Annulohypoxylon truncatum TaxID=327061 RepID=UPI0020087F30|nr:HET-domain-containing protein [Annulohypoxylon truncatum]KAI1210567.1 HET-domain-containing protein [Annulohypoxylon truncatum]